MPLEIYRRSKIWHYRGTIAGRRLRGSTGTPDKTIARRIASEAENCAWRSHLDGPGAHVTMAQAAIAYRDAEKPTRFLSKIEDHWKDTSIRKVTAGSIIQSAIKLYPHVAGATRNRQVIVPTQAIINHAADFGWCNKIRVKRFPEETKPKIPATLEWVLTFARQAIDDDLPHLAALCLFMFGTGARVGETTELIWADIDLTKGVVTIAQSKTKHTRIAHLQGPVLAALANIPVNRNPDAKVFGYAGRDSAFKVWVNVIKRAGIDYLTPHCCRHGFATTMLQAGYDVKTVAVMGGWKDAATVLKYYAHARTDPTVTDAIFGTNLTQDAKDHELSSWNKTRKAQ